MRKSMLWACANSKPPDQGFVLYISLSNQPILSADRDYAASFVIYEPALDKTNKMTNAPSEDSDQPGHPPSLIRVFAVRSMGS